MSTFVLYLRLGYQHIMDIHGIDFILFIIAMVSFYLMRDWKKVIKLFIFYLSFHSLSLALSNKGVIRIDMDIIEYLISVTIFLAAAYTVFKKPTTYMPKNPFKYIFASIFGFIHGFEFADYFATIVGSNQNITFQWIAYNIGIEFGFIVIIFLYLFTSWIFVNNLGVSRRDWYMVISSAIAGVALTFMFESRYWID